MMIVLQLGDGRLPTLVRSSINGPSPLHTCVGAAVVAAWGADGSFLRFEEFIPSLRTVYIQLTATIGMASMGSQLRISLYSQ